MQIIIRLMLLSICLGAKAHADDTPYPYPGMEIGGKVDRILNSNSPFAEPENLIEKIDPLVVALAKSNNSPKKERQSTIDNLSVDAEKKIDNYINSDFKNHKPQKAYLKLDFSNENSHLPQTYYKSFYVDAAYKAIREGNLNHVRVAIKQFDFKNIINSNGNSLLLEAVKLNQINIARILLANGFDPNLVNHKRQTALHLAVQYGDIEMVRLLLTMGADIQAKDNNNKLAIDLVYKNSESIAKMINYYS